MKILAVYPQNIDFRCFIVKILILLELDRVYLKWQHFMSGLQALQSVTRQPTQGFALGWYMAAPLAL